MCLSVAVAHPQDVLGRGVHVGYEWNITHNGMGFRCGYVRVPKGHPWYGQNYNDIPASVHGGLTFGEPDAQCGKGGEDDGYWVGFDFAHGGDIPDPALPGGNNPVFAGLGWRAWTQPEVEEQCRDLCEQAAAAAVEATSIET